MGEIVPIRLTGVPIRRTAKQAEGKAISKLSQFGKAILGKSSRVFSRSRPFQRALALDSQGDPGAAAAYRRAIRAEDHAADAWCKLGILESLNGQKSEAFACFREAVALVPQHPEAHYNLANHYYDTGNFQYAEIHYRIVTERKPSFLDAHWNLAQLHLLQQRYGEAMEVLQRYESVAKGDQANRAKELMFRVKRSVAMDGT